jgi:hypothetical protein
MVLLPLALLVVLVVLEAVEAEAALLVVVEQAATDAF